MPSDIQPASCFVTSSTCSIGAARYSACFSLHRLRYLLCWCRLTFSLLRSLKYLLRRYYPLCSLFRRLKKLLVGAFCYAIRLVVSSTCSVAGVRNSAFSVVSSTCSVGAVRYVTCYVVFGSHLVGAVRCFAGSVTCFVGAIRYAAFLIGSCARSINALSV